MNTYIKFPLFLYDLKIKYFYIITSIILQSYDSYFNIIAFAVIWAAPVVQWLTYCTVTSNSASSKSSHATMITFD